jgi:hypothetical protein
MAILKSTPKKPKATKKSQSSGASNSSRGTSGNKSPEDVQDRIFRIVCENHVLGIKDTPKIELALSAGYGNPRSDGFAKAVQAHIKNDIFMKGERKDSLALTNKGVSQIPRDMAPPTTKSNAELHEYYITLLLKKVKLGSDKVRPLWTILKDRKAHSVKDLATDLGYGNPKSFDNTKIVSLMKDMGLAENAGKGSVVLTSLAFPYKG